MEACFRERRVGGEMYTLKDYVYSHQDQCTGEGENYEGRGICAVAGDTTILDIYGQDV